MFLEVGGNLRTQKKPTETQGVHVELHTDMNSVHLSYLIFTVLKMYHTCMLLNQLFHGNRHFLLHSAGVIHMTRNVEEFCARVPLSTETGKPWATATADGRGYRHCFYICNSSWATKHPCKKTEANIKFPYSLHISHSPRLHQSPFLLALYLFRSPVRCSHHLLATLLS